jgi:hypothetical protein
VIRRRSTVPQVYVAKRDNAKGIFKQYLDANGGQLQVRRGVLLVSFRNKPAEGFAG